MLKNVFFTKALCLAFASILLFSCDDNSQEIEQQIGSSSEPVPSKEILIKKSERVSSPNARTGISGTQTWERRDGVSTFYRKDETIYELNSDGDIVFTFTIFSEDDNFDYARDTGRNLDIALPIWNEGSRAKIWLRVGSDNWSTWADSEYTDDIDIIVVKKGSSFTLNRPSNPIIELSRENFEVSVQGATFLIAPKSTADTGLYDFVISIVADNIEYDPLINSYVSTRRVIEHRRGSILVVN